MVALITARLLPAWRRLGVVAWALAWTALAGAAELRVVSQTVGTDELLVAVAGPGQIAALSHLARDPEFSGVAVEAAAYPQIALGDAETILKFRPTLALFADYSRAELVEQVRRAGVRVMIFERYASFADAHENLRRLAAELGPEEEARAARIVETDTKRLEALRGRLGGARPARVIAPSTYGVIAGAGTTFQDLCDHAAAENLATTLGDLRGHATPPTEQLLVWPIERVVISGDTVDAALAPYLRLPPYQFMPSIKERRVALLPSWMLGCVSHRRIDAYEALARALHPEVFAR